MGLLTATSLMMTSAASAVSDPDAAIEQLLTTSGTIAPGCAAGVFDGRKARFFSAGYADVAERKAIDADTQFYLASISKQFTVLAAAQLIVAGRIAPSDDVRKWIPELPRYDRMVTVDMLMHHISGIRDPLGLIRLGGLGDYGGFDRKKGLALVLRQQGTSFVPGTRYEYSNGGYLLLSEVVERASGEAFATYVDRHILQPIGMNRSFMLDGQRPADPNVARGYTPEGESYALRDSYPLYGGAGGLISTIADFAKYHRDIAYGHRVWTPAIKAVMEAPGKFSDGSPVQMTEVSATYAGGLMLGGRWIEHGGDAEGFRSNYARLRDRSFGVAMFCNRGDYQPTDKTDAVMKLIAPDLPAIRTPASAPLSVNGRFVSSDVPAVFQLTTQGGTMTIRRLPDGAEEAQAPDLTLKRVIDGSYVTDDGRLRLVPDADGQGFQADYWRAAGLRFRRAD